MGQYDRVSLNRGDGEPITRRQRAALRVVEQEMNIQFGVYQGSWQSEVEDSGTTHEGAGVCDLYLIGGGMGENEKTLKITRSLRKHGCQAGFLRGPGKYGGYIWHWHVCDLDTHGMDGSPTQSSGAQWQTREYRAFNDGLVAGRDDPVKFHPDPIRKFDWEDHEKLVIANRRIDSLDDKIEDHQETIEDLRKERERWRQQKRRLLNH